MFKIISLLVTAILLSACAATAQQVERPAWIDNPGSGVSASCTTHVRGRYYQEDLAVSRAREQLSARYGVTVKMTQSTSESVANESASVVSVKHTEQTIDHGKSVKAEVKAKWHDVIKDELWVWVVPIS
jgi:hypothetical protein